MKLRKVQLEQKDILIKRDMDFFIDFIEQVDNANKEYDKIQTLSNTLVNAHEQLKDKNNKIKTLTENNEALNLRVKTLNDIIKEKDNEISFLKSKMQDLKNTIEYWKDKFEKLISFLHDKLHSWYDKDEKYIDVVNDMCEDNVLDDDSIYIDACDVLKYIVRYSNKDKKRIVIISTHQNIDKFKKDINNEYKVRNFKFIKENKINYIKEFK